MCVLIAATMKKNDLAGNVKLGLAGNEMGWKHMIMLSVAGLTLPIAIPFIQVNKILYESF